MFVCVPQKKYYEISFNTNIFQSKKNDILFEDDLILIDHSSLKIFCNYFKYSKQDMEISVNIKYSDFETEVMFLNNKTYINDYIKNRYKRDELSACFFKKKLFPENFILKPYQKEGIKWLKSKKGRLLADDMGLGKTAQSIVAATSLIRSGHIKNVLIVCPRSLMQNWSDEIKIWAKSFKCIVVYSEVNQEELWKGIASYGHFFIINYDQTRNIPPSLIENTPELIICDEAHKLRKKTSQLHNGLKNLSQHSKRFWALTGTPIEKNTEDLISIMQIVRPNAYSSNMRKLPDSSIKGIMMKNVLRRLKSQVLDDITDLEQKIIYLPLNKEQQDEYDKVLFYAQKQKKDELLKSFNTLRSICDDFNGCSSKYDFASDIIEKIHLKNEKVVVFSYKLKPLKEMHTRIKKQFNQNSSYIYEGKMDVDERNEALNNFKNNEETFVLLCSGKVAGEGLNLTEANNVIFLNEWWNPSSNNQARDRVHRIGQQKNVTIYKLRSKNTVEEYIEDILNEKKEITENVIEKMVLIK